jgi:hypothetical protein
MIWVVRGLVFLLAVFWLALVGVAVVEMIRKPSERDWALIGWFMVLKILPTVVPLLSVLAYTFWRNSAVLWLGGILFACTLVLRWALVRFVEPPEAMQ